MLLTDQAINHGEDNGQRIMTHPMPRTPPSLRILKKANSYLLWAKPIVLLRAKPSPLLLKILSYSIVLSLMTPKKI